MTAPDPRVGEPLAYRPENRQAATDDLIRMLTESSDIPGTVKLPREAINMLLAELRDREEKLAKVELACDAMDAGVAIRAGDPRTKSHAATAIRAVIRESSAAVAAAEGTINAHD